MTRAIARRSLEFARTSANTHPYVTGQAKVRVTEEAMQIVHEAFQLFGVTPLPARRGVRHNGGRRYREEAPPLNVPFVSQALACPDCDLLQRIPPLSRGDKARCSRCGALLAKRPAGPPDLPLALTIAAAIVFVVANLTPLMRLSAVGRTASTTVAGGALEMWLQGEPVTGVLVAFCAVIAPGGYLLFMLTLLLAARRSPVPRWVGEVLRWAGHFQVWAMLEVMMLGILVALVKIAELATVEPGVGMYAVGALMLLFPAIMVNFDVRDLWNRVEWVDGEAPSRAPAAATFAERPA